MDENNNGWDFFDSVKDTAIFTLINTGIEKIMDGTLVDSTKELFDNLKQKVEESEIKEKIQDLFKKF